MGILKSIVCPGSNKSRFLKAGRYVDMIQLRVFIRHVNKPKKWRILMGSVPIGIVCQAKESVFPECKEVINRVKNTGKGMI